MNLFNKLGSAKSFSQRACGGLLGSAAVGLITVSDLTAASLIDAGRAMQRLWLTATTRELDIQTHPVLPLFNLIWTQGGEKHFHPEEKKILKEAFTQYMQAFPNANFAKGERGIAMFRIGRSGQEHGYTLRKDLDELLVKGKELIS